MEGGGGGGHVSVNRTIKKIKIKKKTDNKNSLKVAGKTRQVTSYREAKKDDSMFVIKTM